MEGSYLFVRGKLCILKSRFIAMHKVDFGRDDDQFRIYWDGGEALLNADEARIIENQLLGVVAQPHPIPPNVQRIPAFSAMHMPGTQA
jgi:hypothetical protein